MATGSEIERLIQLLARLPGLGPRSARRAALVLLKKRDVLLEPLALAMQDAAAKMSPTCGRWSGRRCSAAAIMCWAGRCRRWTVSRPSG
jgi:recombinational DNA repair protein RecR